MYSRVPYRDARHPWNRIRSDPPLGRFKAQPHPLLVQAPIVPHLFNLQSHKIANKAKCDGE